MPRAPQSRTDGHPKYRANTSRHICCEHALANDSRECLSSTFYSNISPHAHSSHTARRKKHTHTDTAAHRVPRFVPEMHTLELDVRSRVADIVAAHKHARSAFRCAHAAHTKLNPTRLNAPGSENTHTHTPRDVCRTERADDARMRHREGAMCEVYFELSLPRHANANMPMEAQARSGANMIDCTAAKYNSPEHTSSPTCRREFNLHPRQQWVGRHVDAIPVLLIKHSAP